MKLSSEQIAQELSVLENWEVQGDCLYKEFPSNDFISSQHIANKIGELAEAHNHHPEITYAWGIVKVTVTTHDEGGITQKDIALAKKIDTLEF